MTRYNKTMTEALLEVREKFQSRGYTTKEVKMAIGIASDKRYAGGNYTGAVNAIEKIKKGLSRHPQVAAVLKRQNEMKEEPASPDEGNMAVQQLEFMMHAVDRMKMHIAQGGEFPEWMQNKLSGAHEKLKGLYANIEHGEMKEEVKDFREKQQDLTELNGDGNRDRGRYGEDLDEITNKFAVVSVKTGDVLGFASHEKDAKDMARNNLRKEKGKVVKLKRGISTNRASKAIGRPLEMGMAEETLEELAMPRRDFEKLKKGDKVTITYDSSIRRGTTTTFTVTGKSKSAKYDVEKVSMTAGGKGKYYLYSRKGGDATLALGDMGASMTKIVKEEIELQEKVDKKLALKILSMMKNQKFVKVSGDFVPEIYLSGSDRDELKKEFGRLPRGLPNANSGVPVVKFINYALGLDNEIDTEDGDKPQPKLYDYRTGKVIGKPKTVGDAAKLAGLRLEEVELEEKYDTHHKTFSGAMQHAYDYAKNKLGIEIDSDEIDDKVALGPRKPSSGKTNRYRLMGKDKRGKTKGVQIQVANLDNRSYELNMYKEEVELDEKREPFAVIDTADGDKVVGTASSEKGAKEIITTAQLPPMKIKDKKTLKIVKVKKKQDLGYPLKEEVEVDELSMSIKDLKKSGIRKQDTSKLKKDLEKLKKGLKKEEPQKPDSAKAVDQMRDDKKKTRIAQLQLQIAKAQETINKLNAQEKPSE